MEEKTPYFVSDICNDLVYVREYWGHMMPSWRKWILGAGAVFALFYVGVLAFWEPSLLKWGCAAYLLITAIFWLRNRDGGKAYRESLARSGGVPMRNLVYIRQEGIRYRNPETENTVDLSYAEIIAITRTRKLFILDKANGEKNIVSHANLTGGTADDLERWLMEQTGVTKLKRTMDGRILHKVTAGIMAAGLALALVLDGGLFVSQSKTMVAGDAAQVLTELGIQVPEMDHEEDIPRQYIYEELLFYAGMGAYDEGTWEWTPADSGVYAFDLEFFEVGHMYTNFLRGVEAMSRGELTFTDIIEDDSHVDHESGGGWKEITFTLNGQTHTLRAAMMYDWFDPDFANALAKLTRDDESGKRLRFFYDGYQIAYVFWGDDAWAGDFSRATGIRLKDRLE